jgi:exonuclease VII large subunit
MLYTEGNLTAEDRILRRVARSKVHAALRSIETKRATLLDSVTDKLTAQTTKYLNLNRLLNFVEQHLQSQPETAEIERYTRAFPELSDTVSATYDRLRASSRRQLERALAPFEYQRKFRFTKGLS